MGLTILAVLLGLAAGVLTGGRLSHLGEHGFRRMGLLVVGVVLQAGAGLAGSHLGFPVLLGSYGLLLGFALANFRVVGMGVVTIGLALNGFVIALNGGMAVRPSSIVAAHAARPAEISHLRLRGKHHLATSSDQLVLLSDAIPFAPMHQVLSFGDLILSAGVADVLANLLRPARRRGRKRQPAHARTTYGPRLSPELIELAPLVHNGRDDLVLDLTSASRRRVAG
jgi:hypothetical protein